MDGIQETKLGYLKQLRSQLEIRVRQNTGLSTQLNYLDCRALYDLLNDSSYEDRNFIKALGIRAKSGTGIVLSLSAEEVKNMNTSLQSLN